MFPPSPGLSTNSPSGDSTRGRRPGRTPEPTLGLPGQASWSRSELPGGCRSLRWPLLPGAPPAENREGSTQWEPHTVPQTWSYSVPVWTWGFYWRHLKCLVKSTGRPPLWLRVRNPSARARDADPVPGLGPSPRDEAGRHRCSPAEAPATRSPPPWLERSLCLHS